MERFFEDYLWRLDWLHAELAKAFQDLPQEALDWVPVPEANAIGALVAHVAGSERFWLGDVVFQEPSGRERLAEFRQRGLNPAELQQRLDAVMDYARQAVGRLTLADLSRELVAPHNQKTYTIANCLIHVIEHTSQHVAHAQLTRQLWEQGSR